MAAILVADDEAGLRRIVQKILAREGHTVTVAANGGEALRLMESTRFDVLITDLVMPEVEGMQVLRVLRKQSVRPRIIVMSGGGRGSAADYLEVAANLGADATLAKLFTSQDLTRAV